LIEYRNAPGKKETPLLYIITTGIITCVGTIIAVYLLGLMGI